MKNKGIGRRRGWENLLGRNEDNPGAGAVDLGSLCGGRGC